MRVIPREHNAAGVSGQGTWRPLVPAAQEHRSTARASATVFCPGCGRRASLTDHVIEVTGEVRPSLRCPYDCGFHAHVQLEGWPEHLESGK